MIIPCENCITLAICKNKGPKEHIVGILYHTCPIFLDWYNKSPSDRYHEAKDFLAGNNSENSM